LTDDDDDGDAALSPFKLCCARVHPPADPHHIHTRPTAMLVGVGVDLVHLARLRALCSRRTPLKLATRILSTQELTEYTHTAHTLDRQLQFLALRSVPPPPPPPPPRPPRA